MPGWRTGCPTRLRFLAIGTTGLCNASCLHCPTGKPETAHAPRTPMPMPLFEKIITSIVDLDLPVTDQISLGLFGDGLVDPFVVNRLRLVRSALPDVRVVVNTNGAAFNAARHAPVVELASQIALHVESIEPETYDVLMQPLRYENVAPKLDQLLTLCHGKVLVSVPVSRLNRPGTAGDTPPLPLSRGDRCGIRSASAAAVPTTLNPISGLPSTRPRSAAARRSWTT